MGQADGTQCRADCEAPRAGEDLGVHGAGASARARCRAAAGARPRRPATPPPPRCRHARCARCGAHSPPVRSAARSSPCGAAGRRRGRGLRYRWPPGPAPHRAQELGRKAEGIERHRSHSSDARPAAACAGGSRFGLDYEGDVPATSARVGRLKHLPAIAQSPRGHQPDGYLKAGCYTIAIRLSRRARSRTTRDPPGEPARGQLPLGSPAEPSTTPDRRSPPAPFHLHREGTNGRRHHASPPAALSLGAISAPAPAYVLLHPGVRPRFPSGYCRHRLVCWYP
jgi:hypothetical protein